jgi:hypothetical protein
MRNRHSAYPVNPLIGVQTKWMPPTAKKDEEVNANLKGM